MNDLYFVHRQTPQTTLIKGHNTHVKLIVIGTITPSSQLEPIIEPSAGFYCVKLLLTTAFKCV